jgi:hypothetical protein
LSQIRERIQQRIDTGRKVYDRYEKFIPAISFFAGFLWDNLTINRIDAWFDNIVLLLYLAVLTGFIVLFQIDHHTPLSNRFFKRYKHWLPFAIQFLFGGMFSTYVVFYFQSASFGKTLIFTGFLMVLLIANEFLSKRLANLYLLLSLYFFATFSFFIFFIPVVIHVMNLFTYILGGVIGVLLPVGIVLILDRRNIFKTPLSRKKHIGVILLLYIVFNLFYFLNIIPPVPLSLKDIGIYHHVARQGNFYSVRYVKPPWYAFYRKSDNSFSYTEGDTVFCYAAVFAPTDLTKKILHQWEFYSPAEKEWITTDRAAYVLTGGRDGGYRGYTYKKNIQPGSWRVNVLTGDNLILGSISFDITPTGGGPIQWGEYLK